MLCSKVASLRDTKGHAAHPSYSDVKKMVATSGLPGQLEQF